MVRVADLTRNAFMNGDLSTVMLSALSGSSLPKARW
jgi:hypothetical protein